MADPQHLSSQTIARMARELIGTPVGEEELEAVTALLGGLESEMAAMRAMETADTEPATTYDPSQP